MSDKPFRLPQHDLPPWIDRMHLTWRCDQCGHSVHGCRVPVVHSTPRQIICRDCHLPMRLITKVACATKTETIN